MHCPEDYRCPDCKRQPGYCACTGFYKALSVNCTCCTVALEECALRIGPSFIFDLYVHRRRLLETRNMLRRLSADVMENPMAPYINIRLHDHVNEGEWWLQANDKSWGSAGC